MVAIGIDLGTTYDNLCGCMERQSAVKLFANDQGNRTTPFLCSIYRFSERLIGDGAKNQAARSPVILYMMLRD